MNDDGLDTPSSSALDKAHAVVVVAAGSIPIVGSTIGEVYKWLVPSPLERRIADWQDAVTDTLRMLVERRGIDLDSLGANEEFISLLISTSSVALKTHQKEKRKMLKNALLNSFLHEVNYDIAATYIDLIDRLTPTHIALLKFISGNQALVGATESVDDIYSIIKELLNTSSFFKEIELSTFRALLQALEQTGLVIPSDGYLLPIDQVQVPSILLTEDSGESGLPSVLLTQFGTGFIRFI
ncbi:hypothetical protein F1C16_20425 (plasmid) [Hymenobacter sp. NBH84]|uniref:hypothetical protein n=1 Tax=Hymenobacter sp. NBH84 TaxID=2596915 RepID=UPI00162A97FD|nr:hypothetical protein [Hymenobacter sp. NBH84]QNE41994.1 hypothetical protein F1C16_20425 [Hymenobacter sp. NBH84]